MLYNSTMSVRRAAPARPAAADIRLRGLARWAGGRAAARRRGAPGPAELERIGDDASFRRYFRLRTDGDSLIAVDAPPPMEDVAAFERVAALLRAAGLRAPEVLAADAGRGFMLLTDFGDATYLGPLLAARRRDDFAGAEALYAGAIDAMVRMQAGVEKEALPPYDRRALRGEMELFPRWFCGELLGLELGEGETALLDGTFRLLEDAALAQPQVAVHRDYHSRNLMLPAGPGGEPGIIDFQDAARGPYAYDPVSLLKDCYVRWPPEQTRRWALDYLERARRAGVAARVAPERFLRDFDLMGMQRHIKVLGIFARLALRDGKPRYLEDLPRVLRYVLDAGAAHPELAAFDGWFRGSALPAAAERRGLAPCAP